jgi:hypothetical protein
MTFPLPSPSLPDPLVVIVLREYRAKMDDMETVLMSDMGRRWLEIEHRLDSDMVALAYEFERRVRVGEVITQQMVWKAERYQILKARLQDEIRKYNKEFAVSTVAAAQTQYATLGIAAAQDAILASYPAGALSASWTRINVGAVESMIGFAGDGSPLYSLLKNDYPDAIDGLLDALINGLARGLGLAQIGREMADGMGMGLDRALLIARTEAARAYRTASTEQYRKSGVVTQFMRLCKKENSCAACLFLDGEILELGEELSDHPCGRCTVLPVVEGVARPKWQTGKEWFALQSDQKQRKILGPEKWQLWKDEGFDLSRFAQHQHSDVWGTSPRIATIEELTR